MKKITKVDFDCSSDQDADTIGENFVEIVKTIKNLSEDIVNIITLKISSDVSHETLYSMCTMYIKALKEQGVTNFIIFPYGGITGIESIDILTKVVENGIHSRAD